MRDIILQESGKEIYDFMNQYASFDDPKTFVISTTTQFNIDNQPDKKYRNIVNLHKINDMRYVNKFFEAVNAKIPLNGLHIGFAETKNMRKTRIRKKYPPGINVIVYSGDFIVKRILPKFTLTKRIYFFLTRGLNRVMTRSEIMGRLYSCGFEHVDDTFLNGSYIFVFKKIKKPAFDYHATYGPLIRLRRVGKDGKLFNVYKMRTMHPYSEYLQEYVHKCNNLQEGGKFKDDFRVSTIGRVMRKLWIDELPMIINLLKGNMKLVGVRPLSQHYFGLFSKELQEERIKYKPGLVPPFYADMPKTLEEIMDTEMKYLEAYEKHPFRTDWKYFWKAFYNIIFRRARSN